VAALVALAMVLALFGTVTPVVMVVMTADRSPVGLSVMSLAAVAVAALIVWRVRVAVIARSELVPTFRSGVKLTLSFMKQCVPRWTWMIIVATAIVLATMTSILFVISSELSTQLRPLRRSLETRIKSMSAMSIGVPAGFSCFETATDSANSNRRPARAKRSVHSYEGLFTALFYAATVLLIPAIAFSVSPAGTLSALTMFARHLRPSEVMQALGLLAHFSRLDTWVGMPLVVVHAIGVGLLFGGLYILLVALPIMYWSAYKARLATMIRPILRALAWAPRVHFRSLVTVDRRRVTIVVFTAGIAAVAALVLVAGVQSFAPVVHGWTTSPGAFALAHVAR